MGVNVNLRKEIVNQIKLRLRSKADQSGHAITRIPSTDMIERLDYHTGCRNRSNCQQQSYTGLRSPERSH